MKEKSGQSLEKPSDLDLFSKLRGLTNYYCTQGAFNFVSCKKKWKANELFGKYVPPFACAQLLVANNVDCKLSAFRNAAETGKVPL